MSYTNTVLITGGTLNLGYNAALTIARTYPKYLVIICSRTDPNNAAESINRATGQKNCVFVPLDLSSQAKVKAFAKEYASRNGPPITSLLLNAGLNFPFELSFNDEGIESTFAVNHLGHATLLHALSPYFAPNVRVTVTASGTHDPAQKSGMPDALYTSASELARPDPKTATTDGRQRYSTSKLVNVLFTKALARKHANTIQINAFDPGLMPGTGLARQFTGVLKFVWFKILPRIIPLMRILMFANIHTPQESGANLAKVAMGEGEAAGKTGMYYEGLHVIPSSIDSNNEKHQDELYEWTVKATTGAGEQFLQVPGKN